jgi:hypothetical protein
MEKDMRFGIWDVRSLYRSGSLITVARELAGYKLDLLGIEEVRWDAGEIYYFLWKRKPKSSIVQAQYLLPNVLCFMVRIFRLMLVLFYIYM